MTVHSKRDSRVWIWTWHWKLFTTGFWPTSEQSIGAERQHWSLGEAREGHTSPKTIKETLESLKSRSTFFVRNLICADFNNKMSRHLYKCKKKKKGVMVLQIGFTLSPWKKYDFSSIFSSIRRMNGPSMAQYALNWPLNLKQRLGLRGVRSSGIIY